MSLPKKAKKPMSFLTTSKNAYQRGYRSGLEIKVAEQLKKANRDVIYEQDRLAFCWPSRRTTYTPDFKITTASGGVFYVETKGFFTPKERQKHLLVKDQCPDIEIRFVFSSNQKLYKGSKTTYAMWCEKHGFKYAFKTIPDDWLKE